MTQKGREGTGAVVRVMLWGALFLSPLLACARQSAPPGGPPDNVPPVVASTSPDTLAVVEPFDDPVVIRFSERISERPTGGSSLEEAVVVSPLTSEVEVEHGRSSLEVSLVQGYRAGHVYRVRVLPVIQDMFNNPMVSPFELVFSTGAEFQPGVVAGAIRDRITGEPVGGARIHAVSAETGDSVVYAARTDQDGIYTLRYLPRGPYGLIAFEDRNRSGDPDGAEPRATDEVTLEGPADTLMVSLEVLMPDTTPARIVGVEAVDSTSLRIETDDFLDPADPLDPVGVSLSREEGGEPAVDSLLHEYQWEARSQLLEQRAAAAADTAGADTVPSDTSAAAPDTAAPDAGPPDAAAADTAGVATDTLPPDTLAGPYGAGEPPRAEQSLFVLLDAPLEPGVEYTIAVSGVRNISGVPDGEGEGAVVWEPPPPDTADAASDTSDAVPDTAGAVPDTTRVPPDTAGPAPDAGRAEADLGAAPGTVRRAAPHPARPVRGVGGLDRPERIRRRGGDGGA